MAIPIKNIPTLKGSVAENFIENAEKSIENRGSVDFKKEISIANQILQKAKLG